MKAAGCSYSIVLGLITLVVVVFVGREGVGVAICCFTEDFRQSGDCGHFSLDVAVHIARVGCEPDGTPGGDHQLFFLDAQGLVVPQTSIVIKGISKVIFINDNGVAKQVKVNITNQNDQSAVVEGEGLTTGVQYLIEGQTTIENGEKIRVVQ